MTDSRLHLETVMRREIKRVRRMAKEMRREKGLGFHLLTEKLMQMDLTMEIRLLTEKLMPIGKN